MPKQNNFFQGRKKWRLTRTGSYSSSSLSSLSKSEELFKQNLVTKESLQSHFYFCQQKRHFITQRFDEAQSVEERYHWIKQLNKIDLELEALQVLLFESQPQAIHDLPPQHRL